MSVWFWTRETHAYIPQPAVIWLSCEPKRQLCRFAGLGPTSWNSLPQSFRDATLGQFQCRLKTSLFRLACRRDVTVHWWLSRPLEWRNMNVYELNWAGVVRGFSLFAVGPRSVCDDIQVVHCHAGLPPADHRRLLAHGLAGELLHRCHRYQACGARQGEYSRCHMDFINFVLHFGIRSHSIWRTCLWHVSVKSSRWSLDNKIYMHMHYHRQTYYIKNIWISKQENHQIFN